MTYNLTFSEASPQPLKDLHGKFTIHSKRDGKSVRTNFKMHIDLNRDGKYQKEERLIKATKEGYKDKGFDHKAHFRGLSNSQIT